MNGAIPRVDAEGRAAAVHFAVDPRFADHSFHRDGDVGADVPVARAGIDIHWQIRGQRHLNAAVARTDAPARIQLGPAQRVYSDAAVAAPGAQHIKPSRQADAAIAGRGIAFAIHLAGLNGAVAGMQADRALQRTYAESAIAAMQINGA